MIGEFCIVRCRDAGVHCGVVTAVAGRAVSLEDARRVHGWSDGANTLHEMSLRGCGTARISEPVAKILLLEACEVIGPCTEDAKANLTESRWNAPPSGSGSSRRATRSRG